MSTLNFNPDSALLNFLVRAGALTAESALGVETALVETKNSSAVELLVRSNLIDEEELARVIARGLRLPQINLAGLTLDPASTRLIREEVALRHKLVPIRVVEDRLVVATANPLDREGLRAVEFATRLRVRAEVATLSAVEDAIQHAYHLDQALDEYLHGVPDEGDAPVAELSEDATDLKSLIRETSLPPVIKLSNVILAEGVRAGASDIHLEATSTGVIVRYRIDGILEESFRLPKWVQDALTARFKVLAKLDITERRVPQDGRINIRYRDKLIDLRVSSLPTQYGEKITMRVLDPSSAPTGLDRLCLTQRDMECIRHAITRPEGIVLVTGPTGSGKTTTLYGMLAEIISPKRNVVTIENPIEYQLRGVNQVEINEKQGLTFAGTLRSILRQDPDVILIGEIRDAETAEIALRAAQTGHLVLSTLHTNDTISTIARLIDLGIEPYMLTSSLHLIAAQRLVRRNCARCAESYEPDPRVLRALGISREGGDFKRGPGCQACRESGFSGRMAVFEILTVTRGLSSLIESRAPEAALLARAREDGMCSMAEDAVLKIREGLTTPEEVLRVVDIGEEELQSSPNLCSACQKPVDDSFLVCPHCGQQVESCCANCGKKLEREWHVCPYCKTSRQTDRPEEPAAPDRLSRRSIVEATSPPPVSQKRTFEALVVDDEPAFLHILRLTLERSGLPITVEAVSSGPEALARVQQNPPDLILLDVMMPEMDGFEVCERLRSNMKTAFVPILMLTALDDARNRARGFLAGTDDYIGKPFDRAELVARVRRILQRTYGDLVAPASLDLDLDHWQQTTH